MDVGRYAAAPSNAAKRLLNRESVSRLRKRRWRQLLSCFGEYGSWSSRSRTGEDGATNELHDMIRLECSTVVTPEYQVPPHSAFRSS